MLETCTVPGTGSGFLRGVLDFIDCQTRNIGAGGYAALADPGSPVVTLLTALIAISIAILGVRLLTEASIGAGTLVPLAVKLGFVLALATSWAAFRVVAYDSVLRGPAEIVGTIAGPAGLGPAAGFVDRLQAVDDGIVALTTARTNDAASVQPATGGAVEARAERIPLTDDLALGLARLAWLVGTIGAFGIVRLAAGLLLALAPLFAGLLLFEATRGLFMGWVRMLLATALGALGITITLSVALAFLEPWLSDVLALRAARIATPAAGVELLALTFAFAAIAVAMLAIAVRVAFGSSDPIMPGFGWESVNRISATGSTMVSRNSTATAAPATADGRRDAMAAAAVAAGADDRGTSRVQLIRDSVATNDARRASEAGITAVPLGQGYRRNVRRVSGAATARRARA